MLGFRVWFRFRLQASGVQGSGVQVFRCSGVLGVHWCGAALSSARDTASNTRV